MHNDPNDGLSKTMKLGIIWDNGLGALKSFGLKLDNELRLTVVSAGVFLGPWNGHQNAQRLMGPHPMVQNVSILFQ